VRGLTESSQYSESRRKALDEECGNLNSLSLTPKALDEECGNLKNRLRG